MGGGGGGWHIDTFFTFHKKSCFINYHIGVNSRTGRTSNTPFNNSLVRTRPALSRKILSLWMARAKLARAWPALFWCCFYQHQSSARPAPGADQRVSERSSARPGPKFLARSKVTRFPGVSRAGWSQWTVSEHFRSVYGVSSYHDSYPARGRVREWSLKSSAALLIVCERNFLLLGADYFSADLVRTKDDELLKGV